MKFDGMNFRANNTYAWRRPVAGDVDDQDRQLIDGHGAYVVIVKRKDCPEDTGGMCLDNSVKQCVKLTYSLTRMGYGPWKTHTAKGHKHVPMLGHIPPGGKWKTCTVFLVHDGWVYTHTLKARVKREEQIESAAKAVVAAWDKYSYYDNKSAVAMNDAVGELEVLING